LTVATQSGYEYWTAELYRLKGTLTLEARPAEASSKPSQRPRRSAPTDHRSPAPKDLAERNAEACFHEAIETARRQAAKSLELRATTSLTRLLARQGKTKAARALLAEVYDRFTEGFDTADLGEAKALLEDLERTTLGRPSRG